MTKKSEILALRSKGLSTWAIAKRVYNLGAGASSEEIDRKAAYVRVVLNQRNRKGSTYSSADVKYMMAKWGGNTVQEAARRKSQARYADPGLYARHLQACREHDARKRERIRLGE